MIDIPAFHGCYRRSPMEMSTFRVTHSISTNSGELASPSASFISAGTSLVVLDFMGHSSEKKNTKTRLAIEILWGSGYANGAEVRIAHTTHLRIDPPPRALPLGKIPFRFSPEVSLACCNLSCVIYLSCSTACRMNSSCSIVSTISPAVFAPARAAKTA